MLPASMATGSAAKKPLIPGGRWTFAAAGLAVVIVVVLGIVWPAESAAVFTGLALVAAAVAAIFAAPAYLDWREQYRSHVNMELHVALLEDGEQWLDPEVPTPVPGQQWLELRVNMRNTGDRPLIDAILNVVVLHDCDLEPSRGQLGGIIEDASNPRIVANENSAVRFFARELPRLARDHYFLTHLRVRLPGWGFWPLLVDISGADGQTMYQNDVLLHLQVGPGA